MLRTYNGPIDEWDVLNEPRSNRQFMDILGDDVVIKWFRQTESLAPEIKRYINDYNILTKEGTNTSSDGTLTSCGTAMTQCKLARRLSLIHI